VQGHLLNRLLGGPGNDLRNLTPLTYKSNGDHEREAESKVKDLVNDKGKAVRYEVTVNYPKNPQPGAPSDEEGLLATSLSVEWHLLKILSLDPLKTEDDKAAKGDEKGTKLIENVPDWPQF
ncbi:MAG: DNA/RNA non-specific endonuclease, partial [Betaproteobacteria bacterium]